MAVTPRRIVTAVAAVALVAGCAGPSGSAATSGAPVAPTSTGAASRPTGATTTAPDPEANPTSTARVSTVGLTPAGALPGARRACRVGNPLANVYHPYRLQVVSACSTVAGVVESVRHEDDGDVHIDLALDATYRSMLDAANGAYQHGWLVLELVPADQPGCTVGRPPRPTTGTYDYGICTGADESPPTLGQHIWVTGPYVIDLWHDWTEIHPIWSMTTSRPTGPVPVVRTALATSTTSATGSRLTCSASMTDAAPTQYSTTSVVVRTGTAASQVSATARYKSTSTTNSGPADGSGVASIPFRISRATIGYPVQVAVAVSAGASRATCSTSFTPRA